MGDQDNGAGGGFVSGINQLIGADPIMARQRDLAKYNE